MTQYKCLKIKLSNLQLNKLQSAIKNKTDVILRLPSNMIQMMVMMMVIQMMKPII